MGNTHEVVVHHICKVIGGKPIPLEEHLIVQRVVRHSDIAKNLVMEGSRPFMGNFLANDIGLPAAVRWSDASFESPRQGSSARSKTPVSSSDSVFSQKHR